VSGSSCELLQMGLMKLDKTEIARRQLGTALALFIEDSDPVSVHTLACAGCEIAEHLTHKAGKKSFSPHALLTFPDLNRAELRRLQNQYWNTFKHALTRDGIERQDSDLLERFEDEVNDHTLFIGWYDYMLAVYALPIEAQVFQIWYFALYPSRYNDTSEGLSNAAEEVPGRPEAGAARGHLLVPRKRRSHDSRANGSQTAYAALRR
jgi:hypothetical protein